MTFRAAGAHVYGLAFLLAAAGGTACGDDPFSDDRGAFRIRVFTSGLDLDPDGYLISVSGTWGSQARVPASGTVTVPGLLAGSQYSVSLEGIAANCSVLGDNPRSVVAVRAATVDVVFGVTCAGIGSIRITTTTTGVELDPDGYGVAVDGVGQSIGVSGAVTVTGIVIGQHSVELYDVIRSCTVDGDKARTVTVTRGTTVEVAFTVACVATGSARITTATTGVDLDANGYTVRVSSATLDTTAEIAASGGVTVARLVPGDYTVTLGGMTQNCDASGPSPRTIGVVAGATTEVAIEVACGQAAELAVVLTVNGNMDIYLVKANGAGLTRLTTDGAPDASPAWAPDGSKIAFGSERAGTGEIYVMNANGTGQTRLTNTGVAGANGYPSWSPDGMRIAFWSRRDGNQEIYVMNADGTGQTRLTNHAGADVDPAWSPDGNRIAFSSTQDGNGEIYVMNPDGSGLKRLTDHPSDDGQPAWSPDGTKIVFSRLTSCDYYYGCDYDLIVINAEGSGAAPLPSGASDTDPAWSPDGRWIAFGFCYYYYSNCYESAVQVVRADGSRVADVLRSASQPAWRP